MTTAVPQDGPTDVGGGPEGASAPADHAPHTRRRTVLAIAISASVLLAIAAMFVLFAGRPESPPQAADQPLELSLGDGAALASCLPLDAAILADMSPAFAATATSVEGETVTLAVDHWYAGGDATTVVLHAPAGMEALIAGFDFEVGQRYLITAANGVVNYCGFSGPATPELQAVFDSAFPS